MTVIYNAAIYCRLSREDEGSSQSESIKNQIEYLKKYVFERGWNISGIYADDGYTGLNFDRPEFLNMIHDIEKGKINVVITKDLSRLGRDYIQTGHYLEKFFPENKIRFIAVNDAIDTIEDNMGNDMSPFKAVINDFYAKDISKKVKSTFKSKAEAGKFIGAFAPYGYKKHSADKNKLIIDKVAACVVKRIFKEYLSGNGLSHIANMLNSEGIFSPSAYKSIHFASNTNVNTVNKLWGHCTVKNILTNPTYAGNMAQHKYKKVNYKSKKLIALDKSNWIIVNNTHAPIINFEDFEAVQTIMRRKSAPNFHTKRTPNLFSGFAFCAECGQYMTFSKTPKGIKYLICSTYKRFTSKYCTRHAIRLDSLEWAVSRDILSIISHCINTPDLSSFPNSALTYDIIEQFIEKIDVFENSQIIITYKCSNPFEVQ